MTKDLAGKLFLMTGATEGIGKAAALDFAKRGAALYNQRCAMCHGVALMGSDEAPALTGVAFLANWNNLTVGDLAERIRVSMPPSNPGQLNRQQIVDVVTHLLSINGFPAGKAELGGELERLKQIRIESTKP